MSKRDLGGFNSLETHDQIGCFLQVGVNIEFLENMI